jgi:oligopeptide transport system substrate-binding protein
MIMLLLNNPEYDELINKTKTALSDLEKRWENLQEAERILIEEDAASATIYQRGRSLIQKPYVKVLIIHPFGPEYSYKWTYLE